MENPERDTIDHEDTNHGIAVHGTAEHEATKSENTEHETTEHENAKLVNTEDPEEDHDCKYSIPHQQAASTKLTIYQRYSSMSTSTVQARPL